MAKLKDGFYKQTASDIGNNNQILLAGGGSKPVSDFATSSGVVTALGTNGNYVTWTKNGTANNLTVPYASTAALLVKQGGTGTAASAWNPKTSWTKVWGQNFVDSSINSDTGDIVYYLRNGEYSSSSSELCVVIDGDYYAGVGQHKVWHAGNLMKVSQLTNDANYTTATGHSHSYLPLSGGTLTSAGVTTLNLKDTARNESGISYAGNSGAQWFVGKGVGVTGGAEHFGFYNGTKGLVAYLDINGNFTTTKFIGPLQGNADTATRLLSPYTYEHNTTITTTTTPETLFPHSYTFSAMMESDSSLFGVNNYANVLNFSGYQKWGATQFAVHYNSGNKAAIRTYIQTTNTWTPWKFLAFTSDIPTKVSQLTNDAGYTTATGHTHSYLPLAGGTMNSNANISWADRGAWGNSSATYPYSYGGLCWNGTSDSIKIHGKEESSDALNLWVTFGDDTGHAIKIDDCGNVYTVWHTGNLSKVSQLTNDSGYLTSVPAHGVHWENFYNRALSSATWGTLTSAKGYTPIFWMDSTTGGGVGFSDYNGQTFMQIDGDYYAQEGQYKVWHAGNLTKVSQLTNDANYTTATGHTHSYAQNATYLYASDSPYRYGDSAPYYMRMRYNVNSDNRWYLSVYPETPKAVSVDYAISAGTASNSNGLAGYTWESKQNSVDTWVPVFTGNKLQYRVIPAAYNGAPSTLSVGYATSAGSATSAAYLNSYACPGNDNIDCLQKAFNTIPKSVGVSARLEKGSHSMAFGWFLNGYGFDNAYGGWFISDYATPTWVGVSNGSWHSSTFITTANYTSYCAPASHTHDYFPITGGSLSGDNRTIGSTMGGGTDSWSIGGYGTGDNGECRITIKDNSNDKFAIQIEDYTGTTYRPLVVESGNVTATKFTGPLVGNVTGNCSGSSGSCTGNAATATRLASITATTSTLYVTGCTSSTSNLYTGTQSTSGVRIVSGSKLYAANGFFQESDERLKDFFNPISVDLEKLKKLRKSYFKFKGDDIMHIGVSAQEIKELYPEIVSETDDIYNVDYSKLSVIALKAIDELHNELLNVKEENRLLKEEIKQIKLWQS